MTLHPYVGLWNVPVEGIPAQTGAASVMDCSDLKDAIEGLGLTVPLHDVLDVGCGTGRLARLCDGYRGVDIAPNAVKYARREGLDAWLISGPRDLRGEATTITCLSVFTHAGRKERQAYLAAFRGIAPNLLVDILPGHEGGSATVWYADPDCFEDDLDAAGFEIEAWYERSAPDETVHRYYRCS